MILLYLVLGFYLFGVLGRYLFRSWLRRQQRKFERGEGPTFRTYTWGTRGGAARQAHPETKKEGEVTYSRVSRTERKISSDVGDYVEFEEVRITETETESGQTPGC